MRTRPGVQIRLPVIAALLLALSVGLADPPGASAATFGSRALKTGMRGKDVGTLQKFLTKLGIPTNRDLVFGNETRRNVKKLERLRRWRRDGKVSRKQARKIRKLVRRGVKLVGGTGTRFYLYGPVAPAVTVSGSSPGTVRVDVVSSGGAIAASISSTLSSTGAGGVGEAYASTVIWNGRKADGKPALDGGYGYAIGDAGGTGARLTSGQTGPFDFRNHIFPVRGPHNYGGAGSRFGAPRGDRTHQGQDVAASCGTPLVAAQGGTVLARAYQASGAGYYVVIRGAGSGKDYVYFHLKGPGPLVKGQSVQTGAQIGKVGNTGRSFGCHLHFERWTKPGWYAGGRPFDPLPSLQAWDSYS